MVIERQMNGTALTLFLRGRLDTTTAPQLEAELKENMEDVRSLVLDMRELDYLSSAGLRVILNAHKMTRGSLAVRHVNETIMEVFELTGFSEILTIEPES